MHHGIIQCHGSWPMPRIRHGKRSATTTMLRWVSTLFLQVSEASWWGRGTEQAKAKPNRFWAGRTRAAPSLKHSRAKMMVRTWLDSPNWFQPVCNVYIMTRFIRGVSLLLRSYGTWNGSTQHTVIKKKLWLVEARSLLVISNESINQSFDLLDSPHRVLKSFAFIYILII